MVEFLSFVPFNVAGLGQAPIEDDIEGGAVGLAKAVGSSLFNTQLLLRVVMELAQQLALKIRITCLGRGMLLIPDGELFAFERLVVAFDDRFFLAELKMAVQPCVEGAS